MPTNQMFEEGFNYKDSTSKEMTNFFETRLKNLEPEKDMKKSPVFSKKKVKDKKFKKRKKNDSNSSGIKLGEESSIDYIPMTTKPCKLHNRYNHSIYNCND